MRYQNNKLFVSSLHLGFKNEFRAPAGDGDGHAAIYVALSPCRRYAFTVFGFTTYNLNAYLRGNGEVDLFPLLATSSILSFRSLFMDGGPLDGNSIKRRLLSISDHDPLLLACHAHHWFSELGHEASAPINHAQTQLPVAAGGGVVIGRSHTGRLAAPVSISQVVPTQTGDRP